MCVLAGVLKTSLSFFFFVKRPLRTYRRNQRKKANRQGQQQRGLIIIKTACCVVVCLPNCRCVRARVSVCEPLSHCVCVCASVCACMGVLSLNNCVPLVKILHFAIGILPLHLRTCICIYSSYYPIIR